MHIYIGKSPTRHNAVLQIGLTLALSWFMLHSVGTEGDGTPTDEMCLFDENAYLDGVCEGDDMCVAWNDFTGGSTGDTSSGQGGSMTGNWDPTSSGNQGSGSGNGSGGDGGMTFDWSVDMHSPPAPGNQPPGSSPLFYDDTNLALLALPMGGGGGSSGGGNAGGPNDNTPNPPRFVPTGESAAPVPEPTAGVLFGCGLTLVAAAIRRRAA